MSRFGQLVEWVEPPMGAALVGRFTLDRGTRYGTHTHPTHQLVWARSGVVTVGVGDTTWVLPPSRALFVPAGEPHSVGLPRSARRRTGLSPASSLLRAETPGSFLAGASVLVSPDAGGPPATAGASVVDLVSLYLRPDQCPSLWVAPTVLAATPLFAALLGHLSSAGLPGDARARAEAVLFDVLTPAPVASAELTWPRDDRARRVADALAADPADTRDAAAWAHAVGTSERTLSRLFVAETGVGFGRWRTRLRVRAALELLAEGTPVAVAGRQVGYGTASAFIAAFRREVGVTPSRCFSS